jgi:hypothetical protein
MHHYNFKFWITVFWDGISTIWKNLLPASCTLKMKAMHFFRIESVCQTSEHCNHDTHETCSHCWDCSHQCFDMVWYCMWIPLFGEHHFLCSLLTLSVKITQTWRPQSEHSWQYFRLSARRKCFVFHAWLLTHHSIAEFLFV